MEDEHTVGQYKPHGKVRRAVYIGNRPELYGKSALVGYAWFGGMPVAQFNDTKTGYGYGWHPFNAYDFEIVDAQQN